jgi:3'-5' exoribonuclease
MSEPLLTLRESKASPVGSRFQAICALGEIATKTAKTGSTYYEAVIADATDDIKIRVFGDSPVKPVLTSLKAGAIVRVGGTVSDFNGRPDLKVDSLTPITDAERADPAIMGKLTPVSQHDPVKMKAELLGIISRIPHAGLRATVESAFEEYGERFHEAVAALGMHHAFRHGLLEHTLRMAKCAEALLPLYPKVDHALAVAGIVLHDMGKVQEYSRLEPGMAKASFTRAGNLHGHLVLGAFMVRTHGTKVGLEASLMERHALDAGSRLRRAHRRPGREALRGGRRTPQGSAWRRVHAIARDRRPAADHASEDRSVSHGRPGAGFRPPARTHRCGACAASRWLTPARGAPRHTHDRAPPVLRIARPTSARHGTHPQQRHRVEGPPLRRAPDRR